jgi:hypothetical protein
MGGGLFGFSSGGAVPAYASGGPRNFQGSGAMKRAYRAEAWASGGQPQLAMLNAGETVLPAMAAGRVSNSNKALPALSGGGNTNMTSINVPVTVNGGSNVDTNSLQKAIKNAVTSEMINQNRQGGLNRTSFR